MFELENQIQEKVLLVIQAASKAATNEEYKASCDLGDNPEAKIDFYMGLAKRAQSLIDGRIYDVEEGQRTRGLTDYLEALDDALVKLNVNTAEKTK